MRQSRIGLWLVGARTLKEAMFRSIEKESIFLIFRRKLDILYPTEKNYKTEREGRENGISNEVSWILELSQFTR